MADELGAGSVAFPLVSSGIYCWPKDDAVRQALHVFRSTTTSVRAVTLVLFDGRTLALAQEIADAAR